MTTRTTQAPDDAAWYALPAAEVLARTRSAAEGLTTEEAARRLGQYGPNALADAEPIRPLAILAAQFTSFVVWLLIGAGIVSGLVGEWVDAAAILAIVALNAAIGFYQEYNAERALAALKKITSPKAKVHRDGRVVTVPASEVVPGDVVTLESGDLVPADARLLHASSLRTVEAALTGESEPVDKHARSLEELAAPLATRANMVFTGTSIAAGMGRAVVVATGMQTELGQIARLLADASADAGTPLQRRLESVGRLLVWASLAVVGAIFVLGLMRGIALGELFLTSVGLAVAAVPEGLPAVVTVALALGVQRMARRRALVRKLPAVETLGSTNVICTDKTGTLTVGEMTVRALSVAWARYEVTGEGYAPDGEVLSDGEPLGDEDLMPVVELLTLAVGSSSAHLGEENGTWTVVGDPTEGALLACGAKVGVHQAELDADAPVVLELPFDSDRKRMTVVRRTRTATLCAMVKGAPDLLLERCTRVLVRGGTRPITPEDRERISNEMAWMADGALRVLAAAYREVDEAELARAEADPNLLERDLVFVGLAGMVDPPRPEAKAAIERCRGAGIRVVMITGDHPHTAGAIARELGISGHDDEVVTGVELDALDEAALRRQVRHVAVYARVTAAHKLRIVRAWKAEGGVVAMTGDGVNDAPAIKAADIGIAMGRTGTEVTKEASAMVVTDDNFASIAAAVEEGRGIFDNIRKTLLYLLSGNFGELLVMTAAVAAGFPIPLLPIHLLWINLVTDGLPALALATDPIDPGVMQRPPRPSGASFTDRRFFGWMAFAGLIDASIVLAVYLYALETESLEVARTYAFATLVYAEIFRSFSYRSETTPIWRLGLFSNAKLLVVAVAVVLIQPWSHHFEPLGAFLKSSPLEWAECLALIAIGVVPLVVLELAKVIVAARAAKRRPLAGTL
jgi:Ca2+-transporting ATPase